MMCTRCNNILQKSLFRCIECYAENVSDCDMCKSCRDEHIEAQIEPDNVEFKEVRY